MIFNKSQNNLSLACFLFCRDHYDAIWRNIKQCSCSRSRSTQIYVAIRKQIISQRLFHVDYNVSSCNAILSSNEHQHYNRI